MKKILAFLFAVSLFYFVGAQSVLASSNFNVEVRTYLDGSNMNQAASGLVDQARGSKVQFNASGISSEYEFAFYAVNDIVRDDLPQNYEFVVRSNMKITAFFRPNGSVTPANARHVVIFADNNGKIIADGVQYVADGGTASEPSVLPNKPNATYATPKWFTPQGESSLENITSSRVYLLQYVSTDNTEYTVNVTGGSVVEASPYNYNDVVTLQPDAAPAEQVFSHWEDAEGNVLSTKANYKFTVMGNASVQAVFAATPEFNSAVLNMSDAFSIRSGYVTYKGQFDLPAGFTLVEYGFIFSRSSDVLTLDSLGATIVPSNVHNGQTGEFLRSFPNDTFNSVRAYLIVKDASEQEVIVYSDNKFGEPILSEQVIYETGFETGFTPATTYNNTTLKVDGPSGFQWSTYYGTVSSNATITGNNSLQMRWYTSAVNNKGYAITNFNISNVTKVEFNAKSDNALVGLDVLYSLDGIIWEASQSYVLSTTSQPFVYNVSNSSSLYIRFQLTIPGTNPSSNSNLVIDDIKVYGNIQSASHEVVYDVDGVITDEMILDGNLVNYNPSKTGYTFNGWYLEPTFDTQFSGPVNQSYNLYAQFTVNQYSITFNSNGGTAVTTLTQDYSSVVIEPTEPTRAGYEFNGWYTDNNTFNNLFVFSTMPLNGSTLYAEWIAIDYTITFESNGGSSVSPITQAFGTSVNAPADPTNGELIFQGWYSDIALTQLYSFTTMPLNGITLYAKWGSEVVVNPVTYVEFFTDVPNSTSTSSYLSRTWTSIYTDNLSVEWTSAKVRSDQTITGKAITFQNASGAYLKAALITGGIKSFSIDAKTVFTGATPRDISIYINDILIKTFSVSDAASSTFTISEAEILAAIPAGVFGSFSLEVRNTGDLRVTVDNLTWTSNPS